MLLFSRKLNLQSIIFPPFPSYFIPAFNPISLFFSHSSLFFPYHHFPPSPLSPLLPPPNLHPIFPFFFSKLHWDFLSRIGLSYYSSTGVLEDLLSQLYRFYGMTPPHGNSPQVPVFFCSPKGIPFFTSEVQSPQENFEFQIPEMPGPPHARKLEYFLRRLMFPGYSSPHMGETFK